MGVRLCVGRDGDLDIIGTIVCALVEVGESFQMVALLEINSSNVVIN